jgi:hypothetical protein
MAIFQQTLPASLRFDPSSPQENRKSSNGDRRPYLVTVPTRKPIMSATQSITSTRQFFALFPHESEDARLTGATRSLYRRLLALNLPRPAARAEIPAELRDLTEMRFAHVGTKIA